MPLSHGGRYYRRHPERELARKRAELGRLGSAVVALLNRVPRDSPLLDRWHPQETVKTLTRKGEQFNTVYHEKYYALSASEQRDFRAFLKEQRWALPSHEQSRKKNKNGTPRHTGVSRAQAQARQRFSIEGLGYSPDEVYQRDYWGGSPRSHSG
jgi:hypothetical protein